MSVLRFVRHGSAIGIGVIVAGLGCSDPTSAAPQGAFNVTFGNANGTGVTCPATNPSAQLMVGTVGSAQHASVIDGEDGATVSCAVRKSGTGFLVSGSIQKGTATFYLGAVNVGEGMSNEGTVSVSGANTGGKSYGPEDGTACSFHVIDAAEGRAWLSFECPHVVTGSSDAEQCSLYNGYLIFENCET